MPTQSLPPHPDLVHLRYQAKDLLRAHAAADPAALQRLREFLPDFRTSSDPFIAATRLTLAKAQLAIAREYGFPSWVRLKTFVEDANPEDLKLPYQKRIQDPLFRNAVDLIDAGHVEELADLLRANPELVHRRVFFDGGNYFGSPTLLEFVPENPIRQGRVSARVLEIARTIIDAGARAPSIQETLSLTASGRIVREAGFQTPLIDVLCDAGACPDLSMRAALGHGEWEAVHALLRRGASRTLAVSAGLGDVAAMANAFIHADAEERHAALALAAQHGRPDAVTFLIERGEDPNRFNPVGLHSHSTPLHQAALAGHLEVVRRLVTAGADIKRKDILFQGAALGWARHGGHAKVASFLEQWEVTGD